MVALAEDSQHQMEVTEGRRQLRIDVRRTYAADNRSTATKGDRFRRSIYGAAEMIPMAAMEVLVAGGFENADPAVTSIPIGAGLLYGIFNRRPLSHTAIGALAVGGMTAMSQGAVDSSMLMPSIYAGLSYALLHKFFESMVFRPLADRIGSEGFGPQTKTENFLARIALSSGWALGLRLLNIL